MAKQRRPTKPVRKPAAPKPVPVRVRPAHVLPGGVRRVTRSNPLREIPPAR